jgi:hypothetical protein
MIVIRTGALTHSLVCQDIGATDIEKQYIDFASDSLSHSLNRKQVV